VCAVADNSQLIAILTNQPLWANYLEQGDTVYFWSADVAAIEADRE